MYIVDREEKPKIYFKFPYNGRLRFLSDRLNLLREKKKGKKERKKYGSQMQDVVTDIIP